MRFAVEPFAAWYPGSAIPLFYAHWKLIGRHQERFRSRPTGRWLDAETQGHALLRHRAPRLGARGYAIFFVARHWDYPDIVEAKQRAIYIDPAELAGLTAMRFARFIEFCDARAQGTRREHGDPPRQAHARLPAAACAKLGYEDGDWSMEKLL
jgi:hypothetical protein